MLPALPLHGQNDRSRVEAVAADTDKGAMTRTIQVTPAAVPPPLALVERFDRDGDHRLDRKERDAARAALPTPADPAPTLGTAHSAPPPETVPLLEPVQPGRKLAPDQVERLDGEDWYATKKIRTLFLTFADTDWEQELTAFAATDVQVAARLEVDGQALPVVGVRFPGAAKSPAWKPGYKRDLRLTLDYATAGQQLAGRTRLDLQAGASDPTLLRSQLYREVSRDFLPTPASSFVRVVINGEDWGLYSCLEPFDGVFVRKHYGPKANACWTAGPGANLAYLGEDPAPYRRLYNLETPDDPAAWAKLIALCRVIHETPREELGLALSMILDIESAVRFFALENALINLDGYGSTSGSYGLYLGRDGRFRLLPRDAERSFRLIQVTETAERTARSRGPRGGSAEGSPRGGGSRREPAGEARPESSAAPRTLTAEQEAALLSPYLQQDFPKQGRTDLALLMSHSFIAKSDYNHDEKVTAQEWHDFATSWFVVMDEDMAGRVTRDQFIAKVRLVVTPPSVLDGRTTQTFGADDPAAAIARDFLAAIDTDHDGRVVREEIVAAFDRWYAEWVGPAPATLTQPVLYRSFTKLFSQSVFAADQAYVDKRKAQATANNDRSRDAGPGRDGGGSGLSLGPLKLGLPKRSERADAGSTPAVETYREQLDPLAGKDDPAKPLLSRLLAVPQWRSRYRETLTQIADNWLLWAKLGPVAQAQHALIAEEVRRETHRAFSYARFVKDLDLDATNASGSDDEDQSLKSFLKSRRSYLRKDSTD